MCVLRCVCGTCYPRSSFGVSVGVTSCPSFGMFVGDSLPVGVFGVSVGDSFGVSVGVTCCPCVPCGVSVGD